MSKNKYLDLLTLKPGDILFTSEWTMVSIFIQISQCFIHPFRNGFSYSHAAIFLSPQFIYESTREKAVAITPINISDQSGVTNDQSDSKYIAYPRILNGRMVLLWDVSRFKRIAIKRHSNIDKLDHDNLYSFQEELLINGLKDYLSPYPRNYYFLNLLPDVIKKRKPFQKLMKALVKNHNEKRSGKFCSELVAQCYKRASASLFKENVDPATVSPKILAGNNKLIGVKGAFPDDYGETLEATKSNLKSELGDRTYNRINNRIRTRFDRISSLGLESVESFQKPWRALLDGIVEDARLRSQFVKILQGFGQEQVKTLDDPEAECRKIVLNAAEAIISQVLTNRYNWWELQKVNSCFGENCPLPKANQGEGIEPPCSISAMCTDQNVNNIPECVHPQMMPNKIRELVDKLKNELCLV